MPPQHLLKHTLRPRLNNIPMTRNQAIKIPLINPRRARRKTLPIHRTRAPPNHALLRQRLALGARQRAENLRQDARTRVHARLAELLGRRAVEHVVCFDERPGGPVVEDDFLVGVRVHVLPVELGVELGRNGVERLRGAEKVCKRDVFFGGVFGAQLGERLGAEDLRLGVGGVPGAEEDVVLEVCEQM